MIKKKYEVKEHVVTERVLVEEKMFCDICSKEIPKESEYWRVSTHHSDWGGDSYESFEKFDVCSAECLMTKFNEYAKESSEPYNTMEIEVEHTSWY